MKDKEYNKLPKYLKMQKGINRSRCYIKDEKGCWINIYTADSDDGKIDSLHEGEHITILRKMYKIICKAYDEEYDGFQFFLEEDEIGDRRYLYYTNE